MTFSFGRLSSHFHTVVSFSNQILESSFPSFSLGSHQQCWDSTEHISSKSIHGCSIHTSSIHSEFKESLCWTVKCRDWHRLMVIPSAACKPLCKWASKLIMFSSTYHSFFFFYPQTQSFCLVVNFQPMTLLSVSFVMATALSFLLISYEVLITPVELPSCTLLQYTRQ